MRNVLTAVLLFEVTDRKVGAFGPIGNQLRGVVGRTVVDYDPFEIAQRLRAQTVVDAMQRVRPVVGRRKNRELDIVRHAAKITHSAREKPAYAGDDLSYVRIAQFRIERQ